MRARYGASATRWLKRSVAHTMSVSKHGVTRMFILPPSLPREARIHGSRRVDRHVEPVPLRLRAPSRPVDTRPDRVHGLRQELRIGWIHKPTPRAHDVDRTRMRERIIVAD